MEDSGSSAAVREQGAKDVADPHVPITWCPVWPVAAPIVSTGVTAAELPKLHVIHGRQLPAVTLVTVPAPELAATQSAATLQPAELWHAVTTNACKRLRLHGSIAAQASCSGLRSPAFEFS
jgi:hypothetical protein